MVPNNRLADSQLLELTCEYFPSPPQIDHSKTRQPFQSGREKLGALMLTGLSLFGVAAPAHSANTSQLASLDEQDPRPRRLQSLQGIVPILTEFCSVNLPPSGPRALGGSRYVIMKAERANNDDERAQDPLLNQNPTQAYCLLPLPVLNETDNPILGMPSTVHSVHYRPERGATELMFQFLLCPDIVMNTAKQAILDKRAALGESEPSNFELYPWPITDIMVECRLQSPIKTDEDILATAYCGPVSQGDYSSLTVPLEFNPVNLSRFQQGILEGRVEFNFCITFSGSRFEQVSVRATASSEELKQILAAETSDNQGGPMNLTQQDVNRISTKMTRAINIDTTLRGGDRALEMALTSRSDLSMRLLMDHLDRHTMGWDEFIATQDETRKQQLATWLAALVREKVESKTTTQTSVSGTQHEDEQVERSGKGGSVTMGGGFSFFGLFGGGAESTATSTTEKEEVDRFIKYVEKQTGIKYDYNITTHAYEPHSITVYRLSQGTTNSDLTLNENITILTGDVEDIFHLDPVHASLDSTFVITNITALEEIRDKIERFENIRDAALSLRAIEYNLGQPFAPEAPKYLNSTYDLAAESLNPRIVGEALNKRCVTVSTLDRLQFINLVFSAVEDDLAYTRGRLDKMKTADAVP